MDISVNVTQYILKTKQEYNSIYYSRSRAGKPNN